MLKAVLFDMDGLMIDSEPFHHRAYDAILQSLDSSLSEEENAFRYSGISDTSAAADMIARKKLPISTDELVARKRQKYAQLLHVQIVPNAGLIELLEFLRHQKVKTAVASGSSLEEIETVVRKLKVESYFDALCSADQVAQGKPAPDIFLFAASKLAVSAHECLVLEDAPSGLVAGKAAGMKVIVVPSRETLGRDFHDADYILESLHDVRPIVETLLSSPPDPT